MRTLGIALLISFAVHAASWPGLNNTGAQRNSSPTPIALPLRLKWAKDIAGLSVTLSRKGIIKPTARRSNNLSIRDGKILTVVGAENPAGQFASFGLWDIETGELLSSVISPHLGPVYTAGEGDATDLIGGLITQYWSASGYAFTMHGGDESKNSVFDPATGEIPEQLGGAKARYYKSAPNAADATWAPLHNVDASGWFLVSETAPDFAITGNYGSAYAGIQQPIIIGRGMTSAGNGWAGGYHLGYVIEGSTVYALQPLFPSMTGLDQGTRLVAYDILNGGTTPVSRKVKWTYSDPLVSYAARDGTARTLALGDGDGRVYFYGQPIGPYIRNPSFNIADWTKATVLVGVRTADGAVDLKIPSAYKMGAESANDARATMPQIAVLGSRVVVFQPQQGMLRGHVMCFDVAGKRLAWQYNYAAAVFQRSVVRGTSEMAEQAVQMLVAGDAVYVVEPRITAGVLGLRVYRFSLLTGGVPTKADFAIGIAAANADSIALREVAAVDGRLVALVDYDYLKQALAVIE